MAERRMEDYMALAKPQGTHPHESEMNNSQKKMCCGYRVLLSSPSLLDIDFTVFVRFIPFYFHQGKLGCQDLLTRNKPLSLSWLQPSRAGCKRLPGSVWQGRRLLALHTPHSLSHSGCSCIQLTSLQRTKSGTCAWSDTCTPSPLTLKALQLCHPIEKHPLSHVPVINQESPRAGMDQRDECIHSSREHWHSHSNAIWVSPFTFLQCLYLVSLWERCRISKQILSKSQGHKASKNRESSWLNTRWVFSPNFVWGVSGSFWWDWGLEFVSDLTWATIVGNRHPQRLC